MMIFSTWLTLKRSNTLIESSIMSCLTSSTIQLIEILEDYYAVFPMQSLDISLWKALPIGLRQLRKKKRESLLLNKDPFEVSFKKNVLNIFLNHHLKFVFLLFLLKYSKNQNDSPTHTVDDSSGGISFLEYTHDHRLIFVTWQAISRGMTSGNYFFNQYKLRSFYNKSPLFELKIKLAETRYLTNKN